MSAVGGGTENEFGGGWNYRVARRTFKNGETELSVYEVYYRKDGTPRAITENPATLCGSVLAELEREMSWMLLAFKKPVLDWNAIAHEEPMIEPTRDE